MNVLEAIRLLIKCEGYATRSSIHQIAPHLSHRHIAETIVANSGVLHRDNKRRITGEAVRQARRKQLRESGGYYWVDTYGLFSNEGECFKFNGNEALARSLEEEIWIGSIGDAQKTRVIQKTDENEAAILTHGLKPFSEAVIDDSQWAEEERDD